VKKLRTFRKKPVTVEALEFCGYLSDAEILHGLGAPVLYIPRGYEHDLRKDSEKDRSRGDVLDHAPAYLVITTLEGRMRADIGDYIIKGVQGEFYPCKPDIFAETYEELVDSFGDGRFDARPVKAIGDV
jgi:hypothetical protein